MAKSRLIGGYPVIGIRPAIDGRRGPLKVREGLEDQTMNMARAAAKLNLARSEKKELLAEGYAFSVNALKKTADTALCDIRSEGKWIRENVPERITSVIPGLVAYLEICDYMSLSDFIISNAGVREGYLIEFIRKNFLRKIQES